MNNFRNEGQPTLGSAIYEPAEAIANRPALADNELREMSRVHNQTWIYYWQLYIKRWTERNERLYDQSASRA
ncbi:MAG: hypothetical protein RIS76_3998 [Verrucomicrobiota bacterium]|jgi:hypothetical protein